MRVVHHTWTLMQACFLCQRGRRDLLDIRSISWKIARNTIYYQGIQESFSLILWIFEPKMFCLKTKAHWFNRQKKGKKTRLEIPAAVLKLQSHTHTHSCRDRGFMRVFQVFVRCKTGCFSNQWKRWVGGVLHHLYLRNRKKKIVQTFKLRPLVFSRKPDGTLKLQTKLEICAIYIF